VLAEKDARKLLLQGAVDTAPLELELIEEENKSYTGLADFSLSLTWKGRTKKFLVEYKSVATPKNVEVAVRQVRFLCDNIPDFLPMVLLPYISAETARKLQAAEVSGLDFSGNMVLVVPGDWLVIKTGNPNQYPSSQPIKNVYAGKSALIGRVLLTCSVFPSVKAVREEILKRDATVSWGTVSKVLAVLEDDLLVSRNSGVDLIQPARLLDQLAKNYQRPEIETQLRGKSADIPRFLDDMLGRAAASGVRVIGRSEQLYAIAPVTEDSTTIYVSRLGDWIKELPFEETDRFHNLEIVEVNSEDVFFDFNNWRGFPWCSKLQIYLELMQGGKREREIADQIKGDLLGLQSGLTEDEAHD